MNYYLHHSITQLAGSTAKVNYVAVILKEKLL